MITKEEKSDLVTRSGKYCKEFIGNVKGVKASNLLKEDMIKGWVVMYFLSLFKYLYIATYGNKKKYVYIFPFIQVCTCGGNIAVAGITN